jgi:hypothetical protein
MNERGCRQGLHRLTTEQASHVDQKTIDFYHDILRRLKDVHHPKKVQSTLMGAGVVGRRPSANQISIPFFCACR